MERSVEARLYTFDDGPLTVEGLWPGQGPTPGNVGVCFSGGGSRALTAAMGQLRGLAAVRHRGAPLLDQVKAISAVSGGAWAAVPFTFLPPGISDEVYLGPHVADPGRLTLGPVRGAPAGVPGALRQGRLARWRAARDAGEVLQYVADGCIGRVPTHPGFAAMGLALRALHLRHRYGLETEDVWQALVAEAILQPYGLYRPDAGLTPTTTFCLDAAARAELLAADPSLGPEDVFLCVPEGAAPGRHRRPFLICNAAVLVSQEGSAARPPAPLQSTPVFTGVVGAPDGLDANGRAVGGGGVSSYAFDSRPLESRGDRITVAQRRPWSLADALGVSSVYYAELVENVLSVLRDDPELSKLLIRQHMADEEADGRAPHLKDQILGRDAPPSQIVAALEEMSDLVPLYRYWPAGDPAPAGALKRTEHVDGGSLDNTALCALLAYGDIDSIIAFVNALTPPARCDHGALDADGRELPDSRYLIYEQVPPLFGYQPYQEGVGYQLYAGDPIPRKPAYAHNQVFESSEFPRLLRALWEAHGGERRSGPAVATLSLRVLENRWHGVRARGGPDDPNPRPVTVVFSLLARVGAWWEQLRPEVQRYLGAFEDDRSGDGFPNFSTANTHLKAPQVNLLANLTAWCVADPAHAPVYTRLFDEG